MCVSSLNTGLLACFIAVPLALSGGSAAFAQSTTSEISNAEYLAALSGMSENMDLGSLASQTYEPIVVTAPKLSDMAQKTCEMLQAQAAADGQEFSILGTDGAAAITNDTAPSTCIQADTGIEVSYLLQ